MLKVLSIAGGLLGGLIGELFTMTLNNLGKISVGFVIGCVIVYASL